MSKLNKVDNSSNRRNLSTPDSRHLLVVQVPTQNRDALAELKLQSAFVSMPHPDKLEKGGEDAFFTMHKSLAVFDGVGNWNKQGVDPGLYSKELAVLTASCVSIGGSGAIVDGLKYAVRNNTHMGTCTACVAGIIGTKLVGINVGDSGLIVIRDGGIVYRTEEQLHRFNVPYQLGSSSSTTVDQGTLIDFNLLVDDWLIVATDGLWDNVFLNDIVEMILSDESATDLDLKILKPCVSIESSSPSPARAKARKLAIAAFKCAVRRTGRSPFAEDAAKHGINLSGGKMDDITLICAKVYGQPLSVQK